MPANTPKGLPYPLPSEPVAEGAQAIRNLAEALATVEPWHEVGAAGEPGFQNFWVNYGAPFATAGFYRDGAGIVRLKGTIKGGLGGNNEAFGLPVGYRPAAQQSWRVPSGTDPAANVSVRADGLVVITTSQNTGLFLDAVSFRAA